MKNVYANLTLDQLKGKLPYHQADFVRRHPHRQISLETGFNFLWDILRKIDEEEQRYLLTLLLTDWEETWVEDFRLEFYIVNCEDDDDDYDWSSEVSLSYEQWEVCLPHYQQEWIENSPKQEFYIREFFGMLLRILPKLTYEEQSWLLTTYGMQMDDINHWWDCELYWNKKEHGGKNDDETGKAIVLSSEKYRHVE